MAEYIVKDGKAIKGIKLITSGMQVEKKYFPYMSKKEYEEFLDTLEKNGTVKVTGKEPKKKEEKSDK